MEIEKEYSNNKNNIKSLPNLTLLDRYEFSKNLGEGRYAIVFQVLHKKTNYLYACKKLSKKDVNNLIRFRREIDFLLKIDHPNIIKLYEVFESPNSLYLIMEDCFGGSLFDRISKRRDSNNMYTDKEASKIILQIMSAIEYCHNQGIAHRDLKPENLLYLKAGPEENNPLKIIDFGLSNNLKKAKQFNSIVGTAYYISPETLQGKYSEKCDILSAGVILYILLSGEPPFNGPDDSAIYNKILQFNFCYPVTKWKKISKEAKDLLSKMLAPEPQRFTANQVIMHPWFNILRI